METWQEYSQVRSMKSSGWQIIINFSNRYKLHLFYGLALARMFHEMVWAILLSLKSHMCLLSSVEFRECGAGMIVCDFCTLSWSRFLLDLHTLQRCCLCAWPWLGRWLKFGGSCCWVGMHVLSAVAFLAVVTHGCVTVHVRIQYAVVVVVYDLFRICSCSCSLSCWCFCWRAWGFSGSICFLRIKESLTGVCADLFTEWRVIPEDLFPFLVFLLFVVVGSYWMVYW